jgi:hypothetical protein
MLQKLLPLMFVATANAGGEWLNNGIETNETFVPYPPEIQLLFDDEVQSYANGAKIPVLRAFTAFPETVHNKMVWPLLKGLVRRMYPLLGPHAVFYMEDGLSFECRTDDGQMFNSDYCRDHCIRQGRYCVPEDSTEDSFQSHTGRDILQEILRRLCLVQHYHAKEMTVYDYMEKFHRKYCLDKSDITECSLDAMKEVGAHYSALQDCLQEDVIDEDLPSEVLDRNLVYLLDKNIDVLPQIELNEKPILIDEEWPFDSQSLLRHFCSAFDTLPLVCQFCLPCEDVRTCLWKLTCDGAPPVFEVTQTTLVASSSPSFAESSTKTPSTAEPTSLVSTTDAPTSVGPATDVPTQVSEAKPFNTDQAASNGGGLAGLAILFILLVVVVVTCPATYWTYRHFRSKKLVKEILATLPTEKDESEEDYNQGIVYSNQGIVYKEYAIDYNPRYWRGKSCRNIKTSKLALFVDQGIGIVETSQTSFPTGAGASSGSRSCKKNDDRRDEDDTVTNKAFSKDDDVDVFVDEHLNSDSPSKGNHLGDEHRTESKRNSCPLAAGRQVTFSGDLPHQFRRDMQDANWTELMC